MAAMEVLKCQRLSKSAVILRRVWCSLRRILRRPKRAVAAPRYRRCAWRSGRRGRGSGRCLRRRRRSSPYRARAARRRARTGGRYRRRASATIVGIDDVALRLRHLGRCDHHALSEELAHGLVVLNDADVAHHLGPEARVNQVQDGVLHAADVLIDGEPVGDLFGIEGRGGVLRIAVAIEVPAGIDEGVHGVGLAARGPPHFGHVTLTNSGTSSSGERPLPVISIWRGSSTGSWSSGTGTTPHFGQWMTGIGVPQ
jgi:hypothetical protein